MIPSPWSLVVCVLTFGLPFCGIRAADWELLPFQKADAVNPILRPRPESEFTCPLHGRVRWEESHVFNPAAVVRNGKVWLIYRAQDSTGISRLGLAWSSDGLHFTRHPTPVVFPAHDPMESLESVGGCEDPRVVEDEQGTYWLTYTAYDGKTARLMTATSSDLISWKKNGPAFRGELADEWTKSGSIVCRLKGHRFVAAQISGKYWMFLRDSKFLVAFSADLMHWEAVQGQDGQPRAIVQARPGRYDSELIEPGPQAWLRKDGILLLYNGVNARTNGDPRLPAGNFASGQLLFDRHDPTRELRRSDRFFLSPDRPFELTGQVGNVCFIEGMVQFKGAWYLYYGTADSKIAVAVKSKP
jgi:predicted GH43/DUF377 family glycosyl hydrolase